MLLPATADDALGAAARVTGGNMRTREFLRWLGLGIGGLVSLAPRGDAGQRRSRAGWFNVRELGAHGDGARLETKVLQSAIDACASGGGGTLYFPAGIYLTGTLGLKNDVCLHLDAGAVLRGSPKLNDYPAHIPSLRSYTDNYTERSLIYGEGLENVAIEGRGTLDGQGASFKGPYKVRPYILRLVACRNVLVQGVTFKDSSMWVQHYLACDGVRIEGITVRSHCNANNDGIDIDGSQRVRITDCDISSGDDAVVLKSTLDHPCRNVVIANCTLQSDCNALKLGTESNGGFENVAISNCTIYDTHLAGVALELVDGGLLDRVSISNLTMRDTRGAIFIRLGNRARPCSAGMAKPGMGRLRNVNISSVVADGADRIGCSITGLPGHPAEDIALENVRVRFSGGGTDEEAQRRVPEHPEEYPEYAMFGVLPAYGFYCRHVKGLRLNNVSVEIAAPDARPSLVCEDVVDLDVYGWKGAMPNSTQPVLAFSNVRRALLHGCAVEAGHTFLEVQGSASARIKLVGNALEATDQVVKRGHDVPAAAVSVGAGK